MLSNPIHALARLGVRFPVTVALLHLTGLLLALGLMGHTLAERMAGTERPMPDALAMAVFDNSLDAVWGPEQPALADLAALQERFGSDELIVLAVRGSGPVDARAFAQGADFVNRIKEGTDGLGVTWFGDLPYAPEALQFGESPSADDIAAFVRVGAQDPSMGRLLHQDSKGWAMALLVRLPRGMDDIGRLAAARTVEETWLRGRPPDDWQHAVMGTPVLLGEMQAAALQAVVQTMPLVNLIVCAICLTVFRRWKVVIAALSVMVLSEVVALSLFFSAGYSLNYVLNFMVTCVLVVGFASAMHLFSRYCHERRAHDAKEAVIRAVEHVATPSLLSAGTSCFALLSLSTASQAAVAQFGVLSSIGILLVLICTYLLSPALLVLLDHKDVPDQSLQLRLPDALPLIGWSWRHAPAVATLGAILLVLGIVGVSQLHVGSNIRESFASNHPVTAKIGFVTSAFGGVAPFEMELRWSGPNAPHDADDVLRRVQRVERELLTADLGPEGDIDLDDQDILSIADHARSYCLTPVHSSRCAPDGLPLPATTVALAETEGAQPWLRHDQDAWYARLTVLLDLPNAHAGEALRADMERIAAGSSGADAMITGVAASWGRMEAEITDDLLQSFWLGGTLLLLSVLFVVRGGGPFLLVAVLYAFPLLVVTGAAGFASHWTGRHIDSSVMMYLTVAEGIIVDDTIFFVVGLMRARSAGHQGFGALRYVVAHGGDGVILTTLCLALGFSTMLLGGITNVQLMGGLTAAAVTIALGSVLILLPALARLFPDRRPPGIASASGGTTLLEGSSAGS